MTNKNQNMYAMVPSKRFLSFMAGCLLVLSGCVKEDLSDCPEPGQGVILKYRYDLNMDYADKFAERVENLQAFIFDEDGILCKQAPLVVDGMNVPNWGLRVNLDPGIYSVLTWAGCNKFSEHYFSAQSNDNIADFIPGVTVGQTNLEDLRLFLKYNTDPQEPDKTVPSTPEIGDLYHGLLQNITVKANETTTALTPLMKNTNTIRIQIDSLDKMDWELNAEEFKLSISGSNSHYLYDNMIGEHAVKLTYTPYVRQIANKQFDAKIKTLRLIKAQSDSFDNYRLLLNITYGPTDLKICEDVDLVDLILQGKIPARDSQGGYLTDEDGKWIYVTPTLEYLDRQDLFDIRYVITKGTAGDLIFTVYVNNWKITNIYPVPRL